MNKYHSVYMVQCTNDSINIWIYADTPFYITNWCIFTYKVGNNFKNS